MMAAGISTVAIVGAGTMGQGIAEICAVSGFDVILFDINPDILRQAAQRINSDLSRLADKGKLSAKDTASALSRISFPSEIQHVKADLIIEAVVEDLAVKQNLFRELEANNSEDAILVSNTSSLSITRIGKALRHPRRFAGLHFFNPAYVMNLVEIVEGPVTDSAIVNKLRGFCESLGKQAVLVKDSPGFIVNRVARLYYVEALKIAEEGIADFATIDKLMRGAGFRMGPFELMDLIGIDTNFAVTQSIYRALYDEPKFRPSRIQQQKVDAGELGRKTGKGFYDYTAQK